MHESTRIEGDEPVDELERPPAVSGQETTEPEEVCFYFWGVFDPE